MDCTWADSAILADAEAAAQLPSELKLVIFSAINERYLDALALAALDPLLSPLIFTYYEPLFVELSKCLFSASPRGLDDFPSAALSELLLSVFRLLKSDPTAFIPLIHLSKLPSLFTHTAAVVRYLAIRVYCLVLHAADAATQNLLDRHIGGQLVESQWENISIDYTFLSLWEERRLEQLNQQLNKKRALRSSEVKGSTRRRWITRDDLSRWTTEICGRLLPTLGTSRPVSSPLVLTKTMRENVRATSDALLSSKPILLTGLVGSGKSAVVAHLARELGADNSLVTIHLNEQTDAKVLLGMYTSTSPGSFSWQPGVLTTAVREGRWVLIEDFDRAPNDVVGVILPLLERRELVIPGRGERIRAARGFRIIATLQSHLSLRGEEVVNDISSLSSRLWERVSIRPPTSSEVREIIVQSFPLLRMYQSTLFDVYEHVCKVFEQPAFAAMSRVSLGRPLGLRDLIKWCRRVDRVMDAAGSRDGSEAIPESAAIEIFMEAIDCFAGYIQTDEARTLVVRVIGRYLQMSPQQVDYFLMLHTPRRSEAENFVNIGRSKVRRQVGLLGNKTRNRLMHQNPFAMTRHSLRLLEQVAVAVEMSEPTLLVGETGTGKTTVVQQLATSVGRPLTVINLSQQSESGDLLGGFKPVNMRSIVVPINDEFTHLFLSTFSQKKNQRYLDTLGRCVVKGHWVRVLTLWKEALKMADSFLRQKSPNGTSISASEAQPSKRRKVADSRLADLRTLWSDFERSATRVEVEMSNGDKGFAFAFVEGKLVKAARNGEWVLLDEINLASADTLESISDLLHDGKCSRPFIMLSESGEAERIEVHPDFQLFGAMNPATDVGKRDLPLGIRSRFTELFVESPDRNVDDLILLVRVYLAKFNDKDERAAHDMTRLYLEAKRLAEAGSLVDGADVKAHFSLRTLTRTISFATEFAHLYGLRRALYEGFCMGFLTLLDKDSERRLLPIIDKHLLGDHRNVRALMKQSPRKPDDGRDYVQIEQHWVLCGQYDIEAQPHYIITPFIRRNLMNLIRASSTRRYPVLIQGPTSSGKTSMIEHLARSTGNKFVRINNHEHTDLQEYLGTYVSDVEGKLHFQEGILVEALRKGHWIVLDELNLAPTDVLEALNRLLDDNRELLIPETQETVRPHPHFMLFATQNPAGLYGGRKVLSRAFRNRFLELHFDDIPEDELETILRERSQIAPSFCAKIVAVYKELSLLRQSSRLFEQKTSFVTLRDLFRWAFRPADDREQLAVNGFMLLAERVRNEDERIAVKLVIEKNLKVQIDETRLYDVAQSSEITDFIETARRKGVIWTRSMRRLATLVIHATRSNEPVLLVGETGCGKTTVCQLLADSMGKPIHIVNAHQNTESGDIIGAQRPLRSRSAIKEELMSDLNRLFDGGHFNAPVRDCSDLDLLIDAFDGLDEVQRREAPPDLVARILANKLRSNSLFEWTDGALVHAMKAGDIFLLDEISLADDSVLERLNSVLEPQRALLLAEKGPQGAFVRAKSGFQFLATMNPGGDYGKRELSPALRNRFTEIWVPQLSDSLDILEVVRSKLSEGVERLAPSLLRFSQWFRQNFTPTSSAVSIRDLLSWTDFINLDRSPNPSSAVLHGAGMVFIDTLGASPAAEKATSADFVDLDRRRCVEELSKIFEIDLSSTYYEAVNISMTPTALQIGPFSIPRAESAAPRSSNFNMQAPTTRMNLMRVLRALQLNKSILLEGSPGVGKTSLVAALADAVGQRMVRINLSDQTDLMDLFGSDVPVEGAEAGHFAWSDAPFLQAMQQGDWVLLDEMNLASQSVLEGLNACLDHRGEVFVSELNRVFKRHPNFTIFAAQNPYRQGGGRKGLPASFVNRFTVVYADVFRVEDLMMISTANYPEVDGSTVASMVHDVQLIERELRSKPWLGAEGGPWEFNLRDIQRWLELTRSQAGLLRTAGAGHFINLIFLQRFRDVQARQTLQSLLSSSSHKCRQSDHLFHNLSTEAYQIGYGMLIRDPWQRPVSVRQSNIIRDRLAVAESITICVQQNWPCLLTGPSGSGKSDLLRSMAAVAGADLVEFCLNADIDTMDLVGGYEQIDIHREMESLFQELKRSLQPIPLGCDYAVGSNSEIDPMLQLIHVLSSSAPSSERITQVHRLLSQLSETYSFDIQRYLERCQRLLDRPASTDRARFQWIDGILVEAVEQGRWLVLDNANLCSSSVLDRLNSLLEPSGVLSINEHRDANGNAKIVVPHEKFRLFLTVNPRFGELSRAMRNRCAEIYMAAPPTNVLTPAVETTLTTAGYESSMYRYKLIQDLKFDSDSADDHRRLVQTCISHLSISDMRVIQRWGDQVSLGLLETPIDSVLGQYSAILGEWGGRGRDLISFYASNTAALAALSVDFQHAQPINPLTNSALVATSSEMDVMPSAHAIASTQGLLLDVLRMLEKLNAVESRSDSLQVSEMSAIERSQTASKRQNSKAESSTRMLFPFLEHVCQGLRDCATHIDPSRCPIDAIDLAKSIVHLWDMTFHVSSQVSFDAGVFQILLSIWRRLTATQHGFPAPFETFLGRLRSALTWFRSMSHAVTGLSMEALWSKFRPLTASTEQQFQSLSRLDALHEAFTLVIWSAAVPFERKTFLMTHLVEARAAAIITQSDSDDLTNGVEDFVAAFRDPVLPESLEVARPYFESEFEALLQHHDLFRWCRNAGPSMSSVEEPNSFSDSCLSLLSNRQLISEAPAIGTSNTANSILHDLTAYSGFRKGFEKEELMAFRGILPLSILHQTSRVDSVDMSRLDLLQVEIAVLGNNLALGTYDILVDQRRLLTSVFGLLTLQIFEAHSDSCAPELLTNVRDGVKSILTSSLTGGSIPLPIEDYEDRRSSPAYPFERVAREFLIPSLNKLFASSEDSQSDGIFIACAHISVGFLLLFVSDNLVDPVLRPKVENELTSRQSSDLSIQVQALERFEQGFTGQKSSLRVDLLKGEIDRLPSMLPTASVYRPVKSDLPLLQSEFFNLSESIIKRCTGQGFEHLLDSDAHGGAAELNNMRSNISHVVQRLEGQYKAYADITAPVTGMLQCLKVALTMSSLRELDSAASTTELSTIYRQVPFMGASPQMLFGPHTNFETVGDHSDLVLVKSRLQWIAIEVSVSGISDFDCVRRQRLIRLFEAVYRQWKSKLESDQEEMSAKTGLYRYRGGQEDTDDADERDFLELFPEYGEEDESSNASRKDDSSARSLAILMATLNGAIFSEVQPTAERMLCMLRESASNLGRIGSVDNTSTLSHEMRGSLMPSTLLSVSDLIRDLNKSKPPEGMYNFYVDANIGQSKVLVDLVRRVQRRFQQLRQAWPEHATPQDVLRICKDVLKLSYRDPVAKMLVKTERLHHFMHQWQTVASKEYTAIELYDETTSLIIGWRRLELSSWMRLFDLETHKCEEDARSWWFIAYEVVVAAPLAMDKSGEAQHDYAVKLLSLLEDFFSTTSIGQFSQRLRLLRQLQKQVLLISLDVVPFGRIYLALTNFIDFYTHFEPKLAASIAQGRAALQRDMKEIVLLASWKDTNIDALRQSAKRSHHKLFKLVRKFRTLLAQPSQSVLDQGLANVELEGSKHVSNTRHDCASETTSEAAFQLCSQSLPWVSQKPARFIKISNTVGSMANAARLPSDALDAAQELHNFSSTLETQMDALRKQTPASLSDDTKPIIKHLKSRKRRLFAETLKQLHQMGFKHNHGSDVLDAQESLSKILTSIGIIPSDETGLEDVAKMNLSFYKFLNLMPRTRLAMHEHSEDLTAAEVTRSVAYLEALLSRVIQERRVLEESARDLASLAHSDTQMQTLWSAGGSSLLFGDGRPDIEGSGVERAITWLPSILRVAVHIVGVHGELSKASHSDVLRGLEAWVSKSDELANQFKALPVMPNGVSTTLHRNLVDEAREFLAELRQQLDQWLVSIPVLAFVVKQISPWTVASSFVTWTDTVEKTNGVSSVDFRFLDKKVSELADSILVTLQSVREMTNQSPTATDEPTWLVRFDELLQQRLRAFRARDIQRLVQECTDSLAHLQELHYDADAGPIAGAIFAMMRPIFTQYVQLYRQEIQRYANLHQSLCETGQTLSKAFTRIATDGFCGPGEKSADPSKGDNEALEDGTGLGEGQGAEDISKDIRDDEDLAELAQEQNQQDAKEEIEDEKDAVELQDELEGEMGDASEKEDDNDDASKDGSNDEDVDEETGDVDNLDPGAIDEKIWDGEPESAAEKEEEGDRSKGSKDKEEQAAAKEGAQDPSLEANESDGEEEQEAGAEEPEQINQDEVEKTDPFAQDGDALELPEEMELDGDKKSEKGDDSDDGEMHDLSDVDVDEGAESERAPEDAISGDEISDAGSRGDASENDETENDDTHEDESDELKADDDKDEDMSNDLDDNDEDPTNIHGADDDNAKNGEDPEASDVRGAGEDGNVSEPEDDATSSKAKSNRGLQGEAESGQADALEAEDGGKQADKEAGGQGEDDQGQDSLHAQAFKKLGDTLERWHRQQKEIQQRKEEQGSQQKAAAEAVENDADFEHLQDDDVEADTQAMGAATDEQAQTVDQSKAIDHESCDQQPQEFLPDEVDSEQDPDTEMPDSLSSAVADDNTEKENHDAQHRPGAAIGDRASSPRIDAASKQTSPPPPSPPLSPAGEDVREVDAQLSVISLSPNPHAPTPQQVWSHYTTLTHSLSQSLTEQLRLILHPTLATRMRGDFRTGKRLNLKRIIPYIASSYKRDKIWLRRSQPSKRAYQILLALDDSKSMTENDAGPIALQTLVMLARSLTLLEVGQLAVVAFGDGVKVARGFDAEDGGTFDARAGAEALASFTFSQDKTNVLSLLQRTTQMFRDARARAGNRGGGGGGGGQQELWQLMLIVSDGVCNDHDAIRSLVRRAREERLMIIFVIVDGVRAPLDPQSASTLERETEIDGGVGKQQRMTEQPTTTTTTSILDMKEARFDSDGVGGIKVHVSRYMDSFPFPFYLVVRDVKELPSVLAAALRQWFGEVAADAA
ncbi:MAG: hypothetical protein M1825_005083 [Sarcosagium campestre]|nr:MAG: hypothetical protein M1825_005083 [Sarcosagium campestre]